MISQKIVQQELGRRGGVRFSTQDVVRRIDKISKLAKQIDSAAWQIEDLLKDNLKEAEKNGNQEAIKNNKLNLQRISRIFKELPYLR